MTNACSVIKGNEREEVSSSSKMPFLKEVLLWGAVYIRAVLACSNVSVCVVIDNGSDKECQHNYPIIYKLSNLTVNETDCKSMHIYMTSGTHILNGNLSFSEKTEIHGASNSHPSIIECQNNSGIRFSENEILISDAMFLHCHTLHFSNAKYTLHGVTVKHGLGLFSENCRQQIILNSTFCNNTRNTRFRLNNSDSNISIAHSTFTMSKRGASISCRESEVRVVLQSCTFSHNTVGLHLRGIPYVKISDSSFTSNSYETVQIYPLGHTVMISKACFVNNSGMISLIGRKSVPNEMSETVSHYNIE